MQLFFKRGTLETQQTIIIVFIIVVLILLGMTVFYRYMNLSVKNEFNEYEKKSFDNLLLTFPMIPEIVCSSYGVKENLCVDSIKIDSFYVLSEKEDNYYLSKLGARNITVTLLYPEYKGYWRIYDNIPNICLSTLIKRTPVSVYIADKDEYGIGEMVIQGCFD
ncbi:hypothetical protein J4436_00590 [Candidatus Woesearchaeota archaeon]|nr:hypothetical protein [Candidatus Woesearchaeota archaeon]